MQIYQCHSKDQVQGDYTSFDLEPYSEINHKFWDIKPSLRQNEREFRGKAIEWHQNLLNICSHKDYKTLFYEGSRLLGRPFETLYFAITISNALRNNCQELYLLDAPDEVFDFLAEMEDIHVTRRPKRHYLLSSLLHKIRNFLAYHIRGLMFLLPTRLKTIELPKLISLLNFDISMSWNKGPVKESHFFAGVFKQEQVVKYLYTPNRRKGNKVIPGTANVSVCESISALCLTIKFIFSKKNFKLGTSPLFKGKFESSYVNKLFRIPYHEILIYCQFKQILRASEVARIIFPHEDKPLERAITLSAKESECKPETVAYAHAIYNPSQMFLHRRTAPKHYSILSPDKIAVAGKSQMAWLHKSFNYPIEEMLILGSNRYEEWSKTIRNNYKVKRLLVTVSHPHELKQFALKITPLFNKYKEYTIIIRRHPYDYSEVEEEALLMLKNSGFKVLEETKPLRTQLLESDAMIFCQTSSGLESMLLGCPAIYFDMNRVITYNSLEGKDDAATIPKASNAVELKRLLDKIDDTTVTGLVKEGRKFAENFYQKPAPISS